MEIKNMKEENKKTKVRNVTVDAEFIRKAIVMRNRQKTFFSSRNPALIPLCKDAEAAFDKMLAEIVRDLESVVRQVEDALQSELL
jgi:hypothetical protein